MSISVRCWLNNYICFSNWICYEFVGSNQQENPHWSNQRLFQIFWANVHPGKYVFHCQAQISPSSVLPLFVSSHLPLRALLAARKNTPTPFFSTFPQSLQFLFPSPSLALEHRPRSEKEKFGGFKHCLLHILGIRPSSHGHQRAPVTFFSSSSFAVALDPSKPRYISLSF